MVKTAISVRKMRFHNRILCALMTPFLIVLSHVSAMAFESNLVLAYSGLQYPWVVLISA